MIVSNVILPFPGPKSPVAPRVMDTLPVPPERTRALLSPYTSCWDSRREPQPRTEHALRGVAALA
jgi:hypothetical protein